MNNWKIKSGKIVDEVTNEEIGINEIVMFHNSYSSKLNVAKYYKCFTLDLFIVEICNGKVQRFIEKAIEEYAKNPSSNVKEELGNIPLKKISKNVHLSLTRETYDTLYKLTGGERLATAIIEVALWRIIK